MDTPLVLDFLRSQFEPFFRDDILPELEVPDEIELSYEFLGGSTSIKIHTEVLRAIKHQGDLHQSLKRYKRIPTGSPNVFHWDTGDCKITVTQIYVRFSAIYVSKGGAGVVSLFIYTGDTEAYGSITFSAKVDIQNCLLLEYGERWERWERSQFSCFDMRDRIRNSQSLEELNKIKEQGEEWINGAKLSDTPTLYLGRLVALMEML